MKSEGSLVNQLKAVRTRLNLSQQELADSAGITRQTIGGIEAGRYAPSAAVALRLAKTLGCRVEDLFWLEEDLPGIEAKPAAGFPTARPMRVTLGQVEGEWIAHPLYGENAFREEMIPAEGIVTEGDSGRGRFGVQLLSDSELPMRSVLLAGCAPALSLWARSAERWHPGLRVHWMHANSTDSLNSLARGEIHAAGIHFSDASNAEDNALHVERALGKQEVALVNLGIWEEGLVVHTGNPRKLRGVADLVQRDVRLINREVGAGSRLLLDALLQSEDIPTDSLRGYERVVTSHLDVARAVLSEQADVGVSVASIAAAFGLGFVPLRTVRYDLTIKKESLDYEPVQQLLGTLHHRWMRTQLKALGGYDTTMTGEIAMIAPQPI